MGALLPDDRRPGLSPPRFGLGSMLLAMASVCALLAVANVVGPYGTFALILLALAVLAHLAGAALGTQLRENGSRPLPGPDGRMPQTARVRFSKPRPSQFAPVTRLGNRYTLGRLLMLWIVTGAVLGAALGGFWLAAFTGASARWFNLAMGVLAFGLLGAFGGFLTGSFLQVALGALFEASQNTKDH